MHNLGYFFHSSLADWTAIQLYIVKTITNVNANIFEIGGNMSFVTRHILTETKMVF